VGVDEKHEDAVFAAGIPREITLGVGRSLRVELRSAAGGGYTWSATHAAGERGVSRVDIALGELPPPSDPPTSALAPVFMVVTADREGVELWRIRLAREWQPTQPLVEIDVRVIVH
jgi:hypothetical protein